MNPLTRFLNKFPILFRRGRFGSELEEEMAFHCAQAEQEFVASGMTPEAARYAAIRQFGNQTKLMEQSHQEVTFRVEPLVQDLQFALRQWRRNPGFALTAVLILALGMGVSVAIFGFVDAALLQPLPYANPNRLMSVNESSTGESRWPLSYLDYLDWQRLNKSFSSLDVYGGSGYLLRTPSRAEPVEGARVSGSFFQTLGVHPMLGRDFNPGEDRIGGPDVLILSYGAWLHRFGGRRDAVGQTVELDHKAYTIIGVLPRAFSFAPTGNAEFWVPINSLSHHEGMRTFYNFWGIGRLRDGVSRQGALAEMTAIALQVQRQNATGGRDLTASVVPLSEVIIGAVRPILLTLLGGAGLLLLIACINVAGLVLVRSESRRREIALRCALGATRARLLRLFASEGLLFAVFGNLAGMIFAAVIMQCLGRLVPRDMASNMPFLGNVGLNIHTGAFAAGVALSAALLLASTPVLRLSFQKMRDELASGDRGTSGQLWRRLGANMAVAELAITVVLLAGAGLLGQSFYRLLHVPLGFDPNHLATVRVTAPGTVSKNSEQMAALYDEIKRRVSSLPGVQSVGMTSLLPVQCSCNTDSIQIPGKPSNVEHNEVVERHVSPEYLTALRARLVSGRLFTEAEDASKPRVAVINQALARKYFPGEDPIGQRIADDEGGHPTEWEIVGVVEDIREGSLDVETWPAEYFPMSQTPNQGFTLAVRTGTEAGTLLPALVNTLHQIKPNLGVSDEATMNEKIEGTQAAMLHRFSAWLVSGFAAIALVLAVVGLYGVIAYSVSQRTREIGVRMALGAQRSSVYKLVMGQAGWLTLAGLAIGLVCSVGAALLIRSLLFGVRAWDMMTLAWVAVLLGLASMVASFMPARRAALVNPTDALRAE
ncbi:MAG TPA: ABC transporter permease [Terriglobales bacterium]|jgi:predicted permease|nr:ABC transporter permease [Terriglobales bacterium]